MVDIGLCMPTHGLLGRDERDAFLQRIPAREMRPVEVARLAESLGYHSAWFADHVVMGPAAPRVSARPPGSASQASASERMTETPHPSNVESGRRAYPERPEMLDVVATMAAVAAATSSIRLAPSVLIAPYRHPLTVAHQLATVDVLSGGRVIAGVGSGWEKVEFAALDASYEDRGPLTEECVEIYKIAWTEPWIEYHGNFFDISDVSMDPKPIQKPHPPIVYGAVSAAGAERAARVADGLYPMFLDPYGDPGRYDRLRDVVLREAERLDLDASGFRLLAFSSALPTDADDELARRARRMTLTGTPEQILSDLERFAAHGYSHHTVHLHVRSGTMSEYLELVERFGREVIPGAREIPVRPFA